MAIKVGELVVSYLAAAPSWQPLLEVDGVERMGLLAPTRNMARPTPMEYSKLRRSVFILATAATVAGCAANAQSVPTSKQRGLSVFQSVPGDPPTGQATPNPIDPNSGLAVIGGVTATYHTASSDYEMSASYGDWPGQVFNRQTNIPIDGQVFATSIRKCAGELAAATGAAQVFVDKLSASQLLPSLTAAIGGASYASLPLWEAVGVALATIPASELIGIALAAGISITLLYLGVICTANNASLG